MQATEHPWSTENVLRISGIWDWLCLKTPEDRNHEDYGKNIYVKDGLSIYTLEHPNAQTLQKQMLRIHAVFRDCLPQCHSLYPS